MNLVVSNPVKSWRWGFSVHVMRSFLPLLCGKPGEFMEIRVIKRNQQKEHKMPSPATEPAKSFADTIEKLVADARKKRAAEERLTVRNFFQPNLRANKPA